MDPGRNPEQVPNPSHSGEQVSFTPGTYIVQVPKDQIYRSPPSEDAQIADQPRNGVANNAERRTFRSCSLLMYSVVLFSILVIIGLSLGIAFLCFKPAKPIFQIKQLSVDGIDKASSLHRLRLMVNVENPNGDTQLFYKKGGFVAVSYRNQGNCSSSFPGFSQDGGDSRRVGIALKACRGNLPVDIKECRKSRKKPKKKMYLDVTIDLWVIARRGIFFRRLKIFTVCRLLVDTFCKGSKIISRSCKPRR